MPEDDKEVSSHVNVDSSIFSISGNTMSLEVRLLMSSNDRKSRISYSKRFHMHWNGNIVHVSRTCLQANRKWTIILTVKAT